MYAVDSVDGNVTPTYSRVGDVDLNTPGVYYIEYTAADSAGNTVLRCLAQSWSTT